MCSCSTHNKKKKEKKKPKKMKKYDTVYLYTGTQHSAQEKRGFALKRNTPLVVATRQERPEYYTQTHKEHTMVHVGTRCGESTHRVNARIFYTHTRGQITMRVFSVVVVVLPKGYKMRAHHARQTRSRSLSACTFAYIFDAYFMVLRRRFMLCVGWLVGVFVPPALNHNNTHTHKHSTRNMLHGNHTHADTGLRGFLTIKTSTTRVRQRAGALITILQCSHVQNLCPPFQHTSSSTQAQWIRIWYYCTVQREKKKPALQQKCRVHSSRVERGRG